MSSRPQRPVDAQQQVRRQKRKSTSSSSPSRTAAGFDGYELVLFGRAKTALGKQEDHATDLAMVIRGFVRIYRHLIQEVSANNYVVAQRNRNRVVRYIAALARLDDNSDRASNSNLNRLLTEINRFYVQYHTDRTSKEEMESMIAINSTPDARVAHIKKQKDDIARAIAGNQTISSRVAAVVKLCSRKVPAQLSRDVDPEYLVQVGRNQGAIQFGLDLRTQFVKWFPGHKPKSDAFEIDSVTAGKWVDAISDQMLRRNLDYHQQVVDGYRTAIEEKNGALINHWCANLAKAGMDYYNGIGDICYRKFKKAKSTDPNPKFAPNPNNCEQHALARLDAVFYPGEFEVNQRDLASQQDNGQKKKGRLDFDLSSPEEMIDFLVEQMTLLFDYCEIHPFYLADEGTAPLPGQRTNNTELLVHNMARHAFLFFHAYPEAANRLGCNLEDETPDYTKLRPLITSFYQKFTARWPSMRDMDQEIATDLFQGFELQFTTLMSGDDFPVANLIKKVIASRASSPVREIDADDLPEADESAAAAGAGDDSAVAEAQSQVVASFGGN